MDLVGALLVLGFSPFENVPDRAAVAAAFKRKIFETHPDKNNSSHATERAQRLNGARDTLFRYLDHRAAALRQQQAQEQERQRKEREAAAAAAAAATPRKRRRHRPIASNPTARALVEEMHAFFAARFRFSPNKYVRVRKLLELFMAWREGEEKLSELEQHMFFRHCDAVMQTVFPDAKKLKHKNQRAFKNIEGV